MYVVNVPPFFQGYFVQLDNRTTVMSTEKIQKMENLTVIELYEALYVNKSYQGTFSNSSTKQLKVSKKLEIFLNIFIFTSV